MGFRLGNIDTRIDIYTGNNYKSLVSTHLAMLHIFRPTHKYILHHPKSKLFPDPKIEKD